MEPSLLGLSRELRDVIWELCLTTPLSPLPDHPERMNRDQHFWSKTESLQNIGFPRGNPHISSIPLLRCNRQINAETRETISRLRGQHRLNCNIRLLLYGEKELYFNWVCLPVDSRHFDTFQVDFHFTESFWTGKEQNSTSIEDFLRFEKEAHQEIIQSWYGMLLGFLERGPTFWLDGDEPKNIDYYPEPRRRRFVRHIILNFVNTSNPYEDLVLRRPRVSRPARQNFTGSTPPHSVVADLGWYIPEFIMNCFKLDIFPEEAASTVDCLEICVGGNTLQSWDMRELEAAPDQKCNPI